MTYPQHTADFEARFALGDMPWEDEKPSAVISQLVPRHVPRGSRVLDVGCGLGTNAIWLADQGYQVTGCDISTTAIATARLRSADLRNPEFLALDFTATRNRFSGFAAVIDRGTFHTFSTEQGQRHFALAVGQALAPGGLWITVSGSADNVDLPADVEAHGLPRLRAEQIVSACEPTFEVLSLERCVYGSQIGLTDFLAFAAVVRLR